MPLRPTQICNMSLYSGQLNLNPHYYARSIGAMWESAGE